MRPSSCRHPQPPRRYTPAGAAGTAADTRNGEILAAGLVAPTQLQAIYRFPFLPFLRDYRRTLARRLHDGERDTPRRPAGHVIVRALRGFAVQPGGSLEKNDKGRIINVGHPCAIGAKILPGEQCGVTHDSAAVLVREGLAELETPET